MSEWKDRLVAKHIGGGHAYSPSSNLRKDSLALIDDTLALVREKVEEGVLVFMSNTPCDDADEVMLYAKDILALLDELEGGDDE